MEQDYIEYEADTPECRRLTIPEPTEEAVEAGIFGICTDGTYQPNKDEIRSIVEAQVDGLTRLAIEIEGYDRSAQTGCHPATGKRSKSTLKQESNKHLARQYAHAARINFLGHLNAYEQAFGHEPSLQIREFVLAIAAALIGPRDPIEHQPELF